MRRMTFFVMTLAIVLGFTQCKKEQIEPQSEGNTVRITLDVNEGNKDSRAEVNPPYVAFKDGDKILVVSGGHYVGYLEKTVVDNVSKFRGNISDAVSGQPLYFYFLGNKIDVSTLTAGSEGSTTCTVNISDQTDYPHLPVISMAPSTVDYDPEIISYSAKLLNHCSLMKFNVTTASEAAICITGMNNKLTVDFSKTAETGTGLAGSTTDNGFKYGKDDEGIIKMAGGSSEERWIIVLPQAALEETGEAFSADNAYFGTRPVLSAITTDQYLSSGVSMTVNTPAWDGDLSKLTEGVSERYATATDGKTITGTLAADVKVSIADGATVTLNGANINNNSKSGSSNFAGITCLGNATLNLEGGSIINCASAGYPGIQAGPSGNTLTIQGTGSLSAQGGSNAPGIGGGNEITCGNISLLGGQISACGGDNAPGIGSGQSGSCGDISISRNVEKINITGGSGASVSIGTNSGGTLTVDDVDDVSYLNTIPFVYHPVNLSDLTEDYEAENGDVFRGDLTHNVTINDPNATITLSGVNITYGGIICAQPNVRIVCFQANSLIANNGAGIQAPSSGTLTIDGLGSINVQSNAVGCAGIGGKINVNCGTINIKGGNITSCGGQYGAGIGSGQNASCGNIEIEGGAISATGGAGAAGIGSGQGGSCGNIEIEGGSINATGGEGAGNIGKGAGGSCGTVTQGPLSGLFSVSDSKQVRFSRGNLLSDGTFAANQYTYGDLFASNGYNGPTTNDWYALSQEEWDYLCQNSTFGFATVNDIHGLIILPDGYSGSAINVYNPQDGSRILWNDNIYSGNAWTAMENNGVVFLPAAGYANFIGRTFGQGDEGYYWLSSSPGIFKFVNKLQQIYVGTDPWSTSITTDQGYENYQYSVRLVRTKQTN